VDVNRQVFGDFRVSEAVGREFGDPVDREICQADGPIHGNQLIVIALSSTRLKAQFPKLGGSAMF
jgi:hypothetical protein